MWKGGEMMVTVGPVGGRDLRPVVELGDLRVTVSLEGQACARASTPRCRRARGSISAREMRRGNVGEGINNNNNN